PRARPATIPDDFSSRCRCCRDRVIHLRFPGSTRSRASQIVIRAANLDCEDDSYANDPTHSKSAKTGPCAHGDVVQPQGAQDTLVSRYQMTPRAFFRPWRHPFRVNAQLRLTEIGHRWTRGRASKSPQIVKLLR